MAQRFTNLRSNVLSRDGGVELVGVRGISRQPILVRYSALRRIAYFLCIPVY
jgi:hypothetical protein